MSGERTHPVEALSALLDGEVAEKERRVLESHLAACAPCRDLLEDLRVMDRAVATDAVPPVPGDLASRIRERLDEPAPFRAAPRPSGGVHVRARAIPRVPLAAAASLLVAGLLWLLRSEMPLTPAARAPSMAEAPVRAAAPPPPAPQSGAPATLEAVPPAAGAIGGTLPEARRRDAKPQSRPEPKRTSSLPVPAEKQDVTAQSAPAPTKDKGRPAEDVARTESLRSLGYVGTAATSSGGAIGAGGTAGEEKEPPAVEAPPYRVRLLTDGRMSVETAGYTCVVSITREDAVSLAAIGGEARARQEQTVRAAQAAPQAVTQEASAPAPANAAAAPPPGFARAGSPRVCADLSPDDCRFILTLVRERYRLPIAERCGPPPR